MDYEMDDKIENRKADNRLLENYRELDEYEEKIELEKNRLEELSNLQDSINAVVDNLNDCIELLSKSIKGPKVDTIFSDMYNSNKNIQIKTINNIENNRLESRQKLNGLYQEKEKLLEDNREKQQNKLSTKEE